MIDLLTLAILAGAGWIGWRRGTLPMAYSVGALVVGYAAAFLLCRPVGPLLGRVTGLPPMVNVPLGGMLVMFVVSTTLRVLAGRAQRERAFKVRNGWTPPTSDSAGGAGLSALRVLMMVFVVVWALTAVRSFTGRGPDIERSLTARASAAVIGRAVWLVARSATGNSTLAQLAALLSARPGEGTRTLQTLMNDPRVQDLWRDPALRAALAGGDAAALAQSPVVQQLAHDPAFLSAAAQFNIGAGDAPSADGLADGLVGGLSPLVRGVDALQKDPAAQQLLADPALRGKLESRDIPGLLTDPAFNQLAERLTRVMNTK
ncbi:MAG TPA: CvpA family protein [Gemmatimonadales bacterium]